MCLNPNIMRQEIEHGKISRLVRRLKRYFRRKMKFENILIMIGIILIALFCAIAYVSFNFGYDSGFDDSRIKCYGIFDKYNCYEKTEFKLNTTQDVFFNQTLNRSGKLMSLSSNLSSSPNKIIFYMDEVEFVDKTINLTWTTKEDSIYGFYFDFTDYDTIEWNINNQTYVYEKQLNNNQER